MSISAPYLNNFGFAYFAGDYTQSQAEDIARKFDMTVTTEAQVRTWIKAENASHIIFEYTNITNCTAGDGLAVFLEGQASPENYFLNATSDSVQDCNGANYGRLSGQRLCSYPSSPWCADNGAGTRWRTDYWSAAGRAKLISYFVDPANWAANTDGWFFDNMDRGGGGPTSSLVSGTAEYDLIAGDYIGSFGEEPEGHNNLLKSLIESDIIEGAGRWALNNVADYGAMSCTPGAGYGNRVCVSICNGISLGYNIAEHGCISRGQLYEYKGRFTRLYPWDFADIYTRIKTVFDAKGNPSKSLYVIWWMDVGGGGVPDNDPRVKMFALGTHLLYQYAGIYISYAGNDSNIHPETNRWFGAMGAPFGVPSGAETQVDARTRKRLFANAISIVRFRTASGDNYTDSDNYALGDTYHTLNSDGTYGAQVSTVTLKNTEAFVGIKDQGYQMGNIQIGSGGSIGMGSGGSLVMS